MKRILKIELERAFRSRGMTLALLIGCAIVILHSIFVVYPRACNITEWYHGLGNENIHSVFDSWFLVEHFSPYRSIFIHILPILSTLPYGVTYFSDIKGGYIKSICTRCDKRKYMHAKYLATFISGGVTVIFPLVIAFFIAASMLPMVNPVVGGNYGLIGGSMFGPLFYTHPLLHSMLYVLIFFVCGGAYATLALAATYILDYSFFVMILPFGIYYGLGILAPYTESDVWGFIHPRQFLSIPMRLNVEASTCIVYLIVISLVGYLGFMLGGVKRDIL